MRPGTKPLATAGDYQVIAYVHNGNVETPDDAGPFPLISVYEQSAGSRAAVVYDPVLGCYFSLDLNTVRHVQFAPFFMVQKWWMHLNKSEAIAHARWFLRTQRQAA